MGVSRHSSSFHASISSAVINSAICPGTAVNPNSSDKPAISVCTTCGNAASTPVYAEGHFISWQLVASAYLAGLDGYGLPCRWQALHPLELIRCCRRLKPLLFSGDKSAKLLAATCFTALYLRLPFPLTMQVKFFDSGDTWIDLVTGCITRNLGAITNRTISNTDQTKTPRAIYLPPEVVAVLHEICQEVEGAETIGDLLGSLKLTMEDIRTTLNSGDESSHGPELSRFTESLGLFLISQGVNPTVAAQVSGDWSLCLGRSSTWSHVIAGSACLNHPRLLI